MNKFSIFCLAFAFNTSIILAAEKKSVIDWVDPQIGATHCRWFFYTPAALPMGMAKLAPTTNAYNSPGSWLPNGYDDRHNSIEGFAHLHEFQIGGIVTMPTTGSKLQTKPGSLENPENGYRSRFSKNTEKAKPGSYEVFLDDYKTKVELTATLRVGFHRYTYPQSRTSRILFDIGHPQGESGKVIDAEVEYNSNENTISGFVECYPVYAQICDSGNTVKSYFYAKLSKKISSYGTFRDSLIYNGQQKIDGPGIGLYVEFPTHKDEVVEMKVGLSYTSVGNAKLNLEKEASSLTFDQAKTKAENEWTEKLSRIEVKGGTNEAKIKFYTSLYHVLLGRGIAEDVDGSYITNTKKIAKIPIGHNGKPRYHHHNTDGMWGGFWNLTQVWALAYPEIYESYVKSTLDFSKNSQGWMHDGEAAGVYTNGVQTNFQSLIAVGAYNAGILHTDTEYLWQTVHKNETGYKNRPAGAGRYDNEEFINRGFVALSNYTLPNGWVSNFGASHTLEYSFGAYAASELAASLGKKAEAEELSKKALNYRILFDEKSGYIRPREKSGEFMVNFDPMKAWIGFQEGNAAQYTWYVPHDVAGLISLIGRNRFNERLEATFESAARNKYAGKLNEYDSFSGVEQLYNHGNQPCLHNAWLFNYSGKPWLTQRFTRDICNTFYGTTSTHGYGFGQDEDQGQLGAWYVLASIGLFDVQGGTNRNPTMQFGSPLFDNVIIHLSKKYYGNTTFTINTKNNSPKNIYIQKAFFNGKPLEKCFIPLKSITKGGLLEFKMGAQPNFKWGNSIPPPSMSDK